MHRGFNNLDPHWTSFAASLRKGQLYIKMPIAKARALGMVWHVLSQHGAYSKGLQDAVDTMIKLITDEAVGSQTYGIKSVFYMVPVDQCEKDIEVIGHLVAGDETGVFLSFKETLEKGLQSDPEVDWITRVGGPQAHPFSGLQMDSDPVQLSLEDLFEEPAV
jgi:hypothetical protein